MLSLAARLQLPRPLLADGAIGTMLIASGELGSGECPERLNLERAGLLEEIASRYLAAGARSSRRTPSAGHR
jgi:methionine synthase I (cobalamin-dependent)